MELFRKEYFLNLYLEYIVWLRSSSGFFRKETTMVEMPKMHSFATEPNGSVAQPG